MRISDWSSDVCSSDLALIKRGNRVPMPVHLGYHLCYGDFRHKHGIEPRDMGNMVMIANALSQGLARPMNWIHMPVPRDRDEDAYFANRKSAVAGQRVSVRIDSGGRSVIKKKSTHINNVHLQI